MTHGADTIRILQQQAEFADHKLFALGKTINEVVKSEAAEIPLDALYEQGPASYTAPSMQDASNAREALTIRLDDERTHIIHLEIVDVIGHVVLQQSATIQRELALDVAHLSAGTYMLRATIAGEIRVVAIVVQ